MPYPPCGVLPFAGLARYLAPLAFLSQDPAQIFAIFRLLYARYFVHLHTGPRAKEADV